MRQLGEMGLLGIAVPEEYGGLGMGFVTTMLLAIMFPEKWFISNSLWSTYRNRNTSYSSLWNEELKKISSGFSNRNKIRSLLFD
jgi:hypothetical protein